MDKTLFDEMAQAARGTFALVRAKRNASDYFDLSTKGLVGSLIAFVFAAGVNALLPAFLGEAGSMPGHDAVGPQPWQSLLMVAMLYVMQAGFGALALMQFGRVDGLVPYLVATNWVTFFVTFLSAGMAIVGVDPDISLIVLFVLVLVVEINVARLIVTLKISQIVMFFIAQMIGGMLGLMVVGWFFPMQQIAG